jgi:hypothetical protein
MLRKLFEHLQNTYVQCYRYANLLGKKGYTSIFYSITCFGSRFINFSFVIFDIYLFDYDNVRVSLLGMCPVLSHEPLLVDKANILYYFSIRNILVTAAQYNAPSPPRHLVSFSPPTRQLTPGNCHNKSFKNRISCECYKVTDSLTLLSSSVAFFVCKGNPRISHESSHSFVNTNNKL